MNLSFYLKALRAYIFYKLNRPIPCSIEIRVTFRCNLKCVFCKVRRAKNFNFKKELSTKQIFELIDDLHKVGVPHVIIEGGEPLLREDIGKIGLYLKKKRIASALLTNGTLITKKNAKTLSRAYDSIKISLDGLGKTHDMLRGVDDAYKRAIKGLAYLTTAKYRTAKIGIHFLLTKNNYKDLMKMIELFKDKVDVFSVMPANLDGGLDLDQKATELWRKSQKKLKKYGICDQIDQLLEEPSYATGKKYCDAGRLNFVFNPEGNVKVCPSRPYYVGNINDESFYTIWKKGLDEKIKKQIENCSGCYLRSPTERSMFFRKNPIQLMINAIRILKPHFK